MLTPLKPGDSGYIEGIDLTKEEVDIWDNYRYTKDEIHRAVNEFFSSEESDLLIQYLAEKHNFKVKLLELDYPMNNAMFKGHCQEIWNCDREPDYRLHEDSDFPLAVPVEGYIKAVGVIKANITSDENGKLRFQFEDDDQ